MKKIATTILALTMAMGLTACNDIVSPSESISNMSNSLENSTSAIYTDAAQSETESTSISELENDTSSLHDPFEGKDIEQMRIELYGDDFIDKEVDITQETSWVIDDFSYRGAVPIAPDGSSLDLSEASYAFGNRENTLLLGFDFAYLRYAKPIYRTTFNDPDLYNYDYTSFAATTMKSADGSDFFKVQAGDKLENGLVVKSADYWHCKSGGWDRMNVELSGELTLNGVLVLNRETPWVKDKSIYFIPNPCETRFPTIDNIIGNYNNSDDESDKFVAVFDGDSIGLNYESRFSDDFLNIFKDSRYVEATVVVKDLKLNYLVSVASPYRSSAELVTVDVI